MCCLPVPFNLLEMIMNLIMMPIRSLVDLVKKRRVCNSEVPSEEFGTQDDVKEEIPLVEIGVEDNEEEAYLDLVSELCDRYILTKKRMEKKNIEQMLLLTNAVEQMLRNNKN